MFNTLFNSYAEQSKAFFQPVVKFNETLTAHVEKIAKFQMATFNEYAELGLKQFKDASAVKDLESLQGYANAQFQSLGKLNQKMLEDSKKYLDLGNALKDDLVKLAEDSKSSFFAQVDLPIASPVKAAK